MAPNGVKLLFLSINCLLVCQHFSAINCDEFLDSDPQELGLNGDPTHSANYGWKVLWDDISKSFMTTKLYQSNEGKTRKAIKNLIVKPNQSSKVYSPKRSSKCLFGTPYPQHNCGPDFVAKIVTNEYQDYAQKMWKTYLLKNSLKY